MSVDEKDLLCQTFDHKGIEVTLRIREWDQNEKYKVMLVRGKGVGDSQDKMRDERGDNPIHHVGIASLSELGVAINECFRSFNAANKL